MSDGKATALLSVGMAILTSQYVNDPDYFGGWFIAVILFGWCFPILMCLNMAKEAAGEKEQAQKREDEERAFKQQLRQRTLDELSKPE